MRTKDIERAIRYINRMEFHLGNKFSGELFYIKDLLEEQLISNTGRKGKSKITREKREKMTEGIREYYKKLKEKRDDN